MNALGAKRLELPTVARAALPAINQLSVPRRTLRVVVSDLDAEIVDEACPVEANDCRLVIVIVHGREWRLRCGWPLIRRLLAHLDTDLAERAMPGDDLAPLLLQLAAGPLPVEVVSVSRCGAIPGARAVTVRAGAEAWACELAGDFSSWPERGPAPALLGLPMAVAVRIGVTRLEPGVLATLRDGDAVLLERGLESPDDALLVGGEAWVAAVARLGHGWTLKASPRPAALDEKSWTMADEDGDAAAAAGLPVTLAFDVGQIEMTVADFARLGPGSVIDIGRSIAAPVVIRANGRHVGDGELVDIDGALGVRITRWLDAG